MKAFSKELDWANKAKNSPLHAAHFPLELMLFLLSDKHFRKKLASYNNFIHPC